MPGVMTLAVMEFCTTAKNPLGVCAVSVALPACAGWNCVVPMFDPPATVTGEGVMVPTLVSELITFTWADVPPASACVTAKFSDPSSSPDTTLMLVDGAPVVV